MKKILSFLVIVILASSSQAAILVFKTGKRMEVASFQNKAGSIIVKHANGRMESFPVTAVDLEATRKANGIAEPQKPTPSAPSPHSPYLNAVSAGGGAAAPTIKDSDVRKYIPPDSANQDGENKKPENDGQVAIIDTQAKKTGDGQWEVAITVSNLGTMSAQGVSVNVRAIDQNNKVTNASGTLSGSLEPGKQATIPVRLSTPTEPSQFSYDVKWQVIKPAPTPTASVPQQMRQKAGAQATETVPGTKPATTPPANSIPQGASPMTIPNNPMGVPSAEQVNAVKKVNG